MKINKQHQTSYIETLPPAIRDMIDRELVSEGLDPEERAVAWAGRVCDLEDTIKIEYEVPLKIRFRADQLEAMHKVIQNGNDENIYMTWINVVPDGADRDDFEDIAEDDDDYNETVDLFIKLVSKEGYRS